VEHKLINFSCIDGGIYIINLTTLYQLMKLFFFEKDIGMVMNIASGGIKGISLPVDINIWNSFGGR
jgi:hypothetical protein